MPNDKMQYIPSHKVFRNRIINRLEEIATSYTINSRIDLPLKRIFYTGIEKYLQDKDTLYKIIIPTGTMVKMDMSFFKRIKSKYKNVELYPLVVDSMGAQSIHMSIARKMLLNEKIWSAVLTFDKLDAREYGFMWIGYTYYSAVNDVEASSKHSDVYYIGLDKGNRTMKYSEVYNFFQANAVNCMFNILGPKYMEYLPDTNLKYVHEYISYSANISFVKSTNCVLEILQEKQNAQTVRYFEAITQNKKLLTNYRGVEELPYYNSDYIKVFDKVSDIDVDWLKKVEKIDYKYEGDFSPLFLADFVNEIV